MDNLTVVCEKCSKKYRANLAQIKGDQGWAKCKNCGNVITIAKPAPSPPPPESDPFTDDDLFADSNPFSEDEDFAETEPFTPPPIIEEAPSKPVKTKKVKPKKKKKKFAGIGLRGKLMFFVIVPLILAFAGASYFSLKQMVDVGEVITSESLKMLTTVAEKEVVEHTKAVAEQARLYLLAHPELRASDFNKDAEFRKIAAQRINLTMRGFTSLHALPDSNDVWRNWVHINPRVIGEDMKGLEESIGDSFDDFWKVIIAGKDGELSSGSYAWRDKEGRTRDNFLACVPIRGTGYYIAGTTYLDESTLGVVPLPMSQPFKDYLEMISWPQEKEWWKKR